MTSLFAASVKITVTTWLQVGLRPKRKIKKKKKKVIKCENYSRMAEQYVFTSDNMFIFSRWASKHFITRSNQVKFFILYVLITFGESNEWLFNIRQVIKLDIEKLGTSCKDQHYERM